MDEDLHHLAPAQLLTEATRMRQAIRAHRDSSGHALCGHYWDLCDLLPDKAPPQLLVPAWPQFMQGCIHYRQSLDEHAPDAPRSHVPYHPADDAF